MNYPSQEGFPGSEPQPPLAPQPAVSQPAVPQPAVPQPTATQPIVPFAPASVGAATYPAGAPQPPAAQGGSTEGRKANLLVLSSVAGAVLLVFGVLMLGLYLSARGNLNDTRATLQETRTDLTTQVNQQKAVVADQQTKLTETEAKVAALTKDLEGAKATSAERKELVDVLVPCMRQIQEAFDAAANGELNATNSALRRARSNCDRAEIKVNS